MSKEQYIKIWCLLALTKRKTINNNASSSYGLKHLCEDAIGIYVHNEEIKTAMKELGFKSRLWNTVNESYNITGVVNKVVFDKKLGNTYSDECRVFDPKAKIITVSIE